MSLVADFSGVVINFKESWDQLPRRLGVNFQGVFGLTSLYKSLDELLAVFGLTSKTLAFNFK